MVARIEVAYLRRHRRHERGRIKALNRIHGRYTAPHPGPQPGPPDPDRCHGADSGDHYAPPPGIVLFSGSHVWGPLPLPAPSAAALMPARVWSAMLWTKKRHTTMRARN